MTDRKNADRHGTDCGGWQCGKLVLPRRITAAKKGDFFFGKKQTRRKPSDVDAPMCRPIC